MLIETLENLLPIYYRVRLKNLMDIQSALWYSGPLDEKGHLRTEWVQFLVAVFQDYIEMTELQAPRFKIVPSLCVHTRQC